MDSHLIHRIDVHTEIRDDTNLCERYCCWTLHQSTQDPISTPGKSKFLPTWGIFQGTPWLHQGWFWSRIQRLIFYQVHNDSWKYTYHYKSHSWKTAMFVYIVNFHSKWKDWYSLKHMILLSNKKILCWKIHLTNLHFLVTAERALFEDKSIASQIDEKLEPGQWLN